MSIERERTYIVCDTVNGGQRALEAFPMTDDSCSKPRTLDGNKDQVWRISRFGDGYRISCDTANCGWRSLEAFPRNDGWVRPKPQSNDQDQKWKIRSLGDGYYNIICDTANFSTRYMEAFPVEDQIRPGFPSNSNQDQRWRFLPPSSIWLCYWPEGQKYNDATNFPIFQEDIHPNTENGCGSASMNCLTQASHGEKLAHSTGPMVFDPSNPTAGATGAVTDVARVVGGIFTFGVSEVVTKAVLDTKFSSMRAVLQHISRYEFEANNTMDFLRRSVVSRGDAVLILFDKGPNKFHWVCCGGYFFSSTNQVVYVCNDCVTFD